MKHISIILLLALLAGCSAMVDDYFYLKIGDGFDIYYHEDFNELNNFRSIGNYIENYIKPKYEGAIDVWASPEETMSRGYGDCDDIALLFVNIAYVSFGIKCDMIATDSEPDATRSVVEGGLPQHIAIYYNGKCYEPQTGKEVEYRIGYIYRFDEVFNE